MPAKSKAQQRFFGAVLAAKKGEKPASPAVAKAAKGMSTKSAKDFASTKSKNLPEKVSESLFKCNELNNRNVNEAPLFSQVLEEKLTGL